MVELFGLERSVYTRIARLALHEKGVTYTLHETEIFGPGGVPAAHFERHPFGRIPVLRHDDFMLYETAAITRYVDEAFDGPPLQPAAPRARARMNQLIGVVDAYAYRPMVWGVFVERLRIPQGGGRADEAKVAEALVASRTALRALAALAAPDGDVPYLVAAAPTLADLHLYPVLRYLALAPEGAALLQDFPRLAAWLETMAARRSVQSTLGRYEGPAG